MSLARLLSIVTAFLLAGAVLWLTAAPPETGRLWFGVWRTRWLILAGVLALFGGGVGLSSLSRVWLFRCAAMALSLAPMFGFVELSGRVGLLDVPRLFGLGRADVLGGTSTPNIEVSGEAYLDTALAWGLPQTPIPFYYVTNQLGYRNPPGRVEGRIYTLGDSMLVSALTSFDRSLPALLEARTRAAVVNLALIGLGPQEEIELLRSSGLPLDGRLVLHFLFEGNDLEDSLAFRGVARVTDHFESRRSFVRMLTVSLQQWTQPVDAIVKRRSCQIDGQLYTFFWTPEDYADSASEHDEIMTAIKSAAAETRAAGGRYALVYVPTKLRILGPSCTWPMESDLKGLTSRLSPWRSQIQLAAEAAGLPLLDLTEALLSSMREGRVPWFWGDTHLNEVGQEVMAKEVAAWIAPWLESESEEPEDVGA